MSEVGCMFVGTYGVSGNRCGQWGHPWHGTRLYLCGTHARALDADLVAETQNGREDGSLPMTLATNIIRAERERVEWSKARARRELQEAERAVDGRLRAIIQGELPT